MKVRADIKMPEPIELDVDPVQMRGYTDKEMLRFRLAQLAWEDIKRNTPDTIVSISETDLNYLYNEIRRVSDDH